MRKLITIGAVFLTLFLIQGCATTVQHDGGTTTTTKYRLVYGPVNEVIITNYTPKPWLAKGFDLPTTKLQPGGEVTIRIYGPYVDRRPKVSYRVFEIDEGGYKTGAGSSQRFRLNTRDNDVHVCEIRPQYFSCR